MRRVSVLAPIILTPSINATPSLNHWYIIDPLPVVTIEKAASCPPDNDELKLTPVIERSDGLGGSGNTVNGKSILRASRPPADTTTEKTPLSFVSELEIVSRCVLAPLNRGCVPRGTPSLNHWNEKPSAGGV